MRNSKSYLVFLLFLYLSTKAELSFGQEKTSPFVRYSVDISYGYPIYQGDFSSLFGPSQPYNGTTLGNSLQYNQSSISGSFSIPYDYGLTFRIRGTQSIVYFSENQALVNFKNSSYDVSFLVQYQFSFKKFNTYLIGGVGYHTTSNASIFETVTETKQNPNFGYVQNMSTTFGFGLEYLVWRQFSIFAEADLFFTGTDRFDGYNGFNPGAIELEEEKSYFQRDKLITTRGGIRVYIFGKSKLIAERPFDKTLSSHYENPYKSVEVPKKDELKEDELPEELKKLGVQRKLTGYSLEVNRVITIDELKRQKDSGEKVISSINRMYPNAKVQLLLESRGFTIHIGGFGSFNEAKSALFSVRQFYSDALVKRH